MLGFIFARGGSKGIHRKNLSTLKGNSLLELAINQAYAVTGITKVIVSTDDEEIADVAKRNGAEILKRPLELALDETPEWFAWQHALSVYSAELDVGGWPFVVVPTTCPLRHVSDIERCIDLFLSRADDVDGVITVTPSVRNPWFNMVVYDDDGLAKLAFTENNKLNGIKEIYRRQDAKSCFDVTTGCYVLSNKFLAGGKHLFDGRLEAIELPQSRALDIDTPLDLKIADFLFSKDENQ